MTEFDSHFDSGMDDLLLTFGEPIVYFFRGGGQRSMTAIIERDPPAFYGPGGDVIKASYRVSVDADCTCGVLASETDQGDCIEFMAERGDTKPTRATFLVLVSQDGGACDIAFK